MYLIRYLILVFAACFAAAAPAPNGMPRDAVDPDFLQQLENFYARDLKTTISHVNGKRQSYQWVCNGLDLSLSSIRVCLNYLQLTVRTNTCTADPSNTAKGQLCQNDDVYVSGLSRTGKKVTVQCLAAGDAVNFIMNQCGSGGGSAVANGNGDFIVHVTDHWV